MTPLLAVEGLTKRHRTPRGPVGCVDLSFTLDAGRTLAVVGPSGAGKTTLARVLLRLERPDAGRVMFDGRDWLALEGAALRAARPAMQAVFQDTSGALDPRMRVADALLEPLRIHGRVTEGEAPARVAAMLAEVGLDAALAARHPHELSGGQRQRVGIARALALGPRLLICDEPVSALDAVARDQVLAVLGALRRARGLAVLLIAHDAALVAREADAILALGPDGRVRPPASR